VTAPRADLAAQVLLLAGELAALGQDLTARITVVEERAARLAEGLERLAVQDAALAELAARLDALTSALAGQEQATPPVWDWAAMDREQAARAWSVLSEWVRTVLAGQYGLVGTATGGNKKTVRFPPCWYRHADLVWELSWLCQEWLLLYRTGYGTPARCGDWHDRYLPGLQRRPAATSAAECKHTHIEPILAEHAGVDDDETLSSYIRADLQARPAPTNNPLATSGPHQRAITPV
jgi:hypothetical protein